MSTPDLPMLGSSSPAFTQRPQVVPPEALQQCTVIVGNAGSGKTSCARGSFVEAILANRRRAVIIDPTGVWWGLRFKPDGSPGFRIPILGGLYGDVPLQAHDAERVATWIGDNDVPVILDVSEMTIGERQDFGTEFFALLYKTNRRPLALVIDEADEFAPQNPMPETKRLLHHVDRIVRRGRVRGFRPIMITQRPSVLHKNVMSQATALVAMRLLGSQDRDAVQLWIKGQGDLAAGKEVLNTLARQQTGEGWLWIPGLGILNRGRFRMFDTFDSSRTPKDDEPPVEPPGPLPYHDEFRELLETVVDQEPAGDARTESALARLPPGDDELAAADRAGYERGHRAGFEKGFNAATSTLQGKISGVLKAGSDFCEQLRDITTQLATDSAAVVLPAAEIASRLNARGPMKMAEIGAAAATPAPAVQRARQVVSSNPAADKMLLALAGLREQKKWLDVCVLAGMLHANGNFYVGRKFLLDNGYVTEGSGMVLITPAGLKVAGGRQPALTRAAIVAQWAAKLRAPGGLMLQAIAGARGFTMSKAQLAGALRIKPDNGNWYGGVKAARTAGLIEHDGDTYRLTTIVREAP